MLQSVPVRRSPIFCALALVILLTNPLKAEKTKSHEVVMRVGGGRIDITLPDPETEPPLKLSSQDLLAWVRSAARAVSHYYGRFPVPHLTLDIHAGRGRGIHRGVTFPKGGGLIHVTVGQATEVSDLKEDWVLTHEMIHLAFPSLADNHHWLEEGISTYVEPVARAQVGQFPAAEVWKQFILNMPKGQPSYGDRGLDNTPTWGRTYWGGALFCLLADVRIRESTRNRKGLRDALRAIRNHGGVISEDWKIGKALRIGDQATGSNVLQELYQEMRDQPAPADLDQLWRKLGLSLKGGEVLFDNQAPEAAICRAIVPRRH